MIEISKRPWYREPWPWLLMLGPFVVVVAGIYTAWLALSTSDGLVEENYYSKGLAVNRTLARSENAKAMGLAARVSIVDGEFRVRLTAGAAGFTQPERLTITLAHPTRAGVDQTQAFVKTGPHYAGRLQLPASGHWLLLIEDDAKLWRLMGNVVLPAVGEVIIGGESERGES